MAPPIQSESDSAVTLYQTLVLITQTMLLAAQKQDWDSVLSHGQRYCDQVERLRNLEPASPPNDAARARKHDLLIQILANDAAIRDLAMPQLARLTELLGRMKRQQALLSAYGPAPNA